MAITKKPRKGGVFAKFIEDGTAFTVPSAGTVGAEAKPGIADTGWTDIGKIEEADFEPPAIQDEEEIFAPDAETGDYVLTDIEEGGAKIMGAITCLEDSALIRRLLWRTQKITGTSTQANPNGGRLPKGWLHIDVIDQHGDVVETTEMYVRLKLKSAIKRSRKLSKPVIEWTMLHSSLQTMGFET